MSGTSDVQQVVVRTGDIEQRQRLGQAQQIISKWRGEAAGVPSEPDRDQRLQAPADPLQIDVGAKAPDDPSPLQLPDALKAGRRGKAGQGAQFLVGDPGIFLQRLHNGCIRSIHANAPSQGRIFFGAGGYI